MVMNIDDVELGFLYAVGRHVQHGEGLEVSQKQSLFLIGVLGGLVADLRGGRLGLAGQRARY